MKPIRHGQPKTKSATKNKTKNTGPLTIVEAMRIVRSCIRLVTGFDRTTPDARLDTLGIASSASLQKLKRSVAKKLAEQGYLLLHELDFKKSSSVSEICIQMVRASATVKPVPSPKPAGGKLRRLGLKKSSKRLTRAPGGSPPKRKKPAGRPRRSAPPYSVDYDVREPEPEPHSISESDEDASLTIEHRLEHMEKYPAVELPSISADYESAGLTLDGVEEDAIVFARSGPHGGSIASAEYVTEPSAPVMRTIECTPQLEIKKVLTPLKAWLMTVFVDQGPPAEGAEVQQAGFEVPEGVTSFPVEVWFDCSIHFTVEDVAVPQIITVQADSRVSDELGFTLKVRRALNDSRPMFISAFFRYNGRPSGKITRYLEVVAGKLGWKKFQATDNDTAPPRSGTPPSMRIEKGVPADIRVEITATKDEDGNASELLFNMHCFTPQNEWKGKWSLPRVAAEMVKATMDTFINGKGKTRVDSLMGAGMAFWQVLPPKARDLLWTALEEGAKTMAVVTEEPYLPWELIVPYKDIRKPRRSLGVDLQLGRWSTGEYKAPPQRIPLRSGYVIAPRGSGLRKATEEQEFLTEKLKPAFTSGVVTATRDAITEALSGEMRDVIHFVCHGKSAVLQTLELENEETIDSQGVIANPGFQNAFLSRPLAFLNACEVGGAVLGLIGLGGFAHSFIELDAAAVIAPLWAVQDEAAFEVTKTFYKQALMQVPFAQIMQAIRIRAYNETPVIDSYAAYCFYGDPMAKVR